MVLETGGDSGEQNKIGTENSGDEFGDALRSIL